MGFKLKQLEIKFDLSSSARTEVSEMNPVCTFPQDFLKIQLTVVLTSTPRSSGWSLSFRLSNQHFVRISHIPMSATRLAHPILVAVTIIIISCHRFSFFPGTSPLEPVVNPTTQASSLSL
jgi:hypothetical protein